MRIVPFLPEHLDDLASAATLTIENGAALAGTGMAYTGMVGNRAIGCAGLVEQWGGRACAWAVLSAETGPHMLAISRAVRRGLDMHGYRRVEAAVRVDYPPAGKRWMELLGFRWECRAECYTPDGVAADLYSRVVM